MSSIRIHRRSRGDRFTVLANDLLQNKALSWGARGLLSYLLSLPTDWNLKVSSLIDQAPDGKARFFRLKTELEEAGYLRKSARRNPAGHIVEWVWEVTDEAHNYPDSGIPDSGFPDSGKPDSGKSDTYKRHIDKEPRDKEPTPPYPPQGGESEGQPAAADPTPEPEPKQPDRLAARYRTYPWLDSHGRPLPEFLEHVIRSLPKKDDRAEAVAMARAYIRKAGNLEGRLEAVEDLWADFSTAREQQAQQEQTAFDMARVEQALRAQRGY